MDIDLTPWVEKQTYRAGIALVKFGKRLFGEKQAAWLAFADGRPATVEFCVIDGRTYVIDTALLTPFGDDVSSPPWLVSARAGERATFVVEDTAGPGKTTRNVAFTEVTDTALKLRVFYLTLHHEPMRQRAVAAPQRAPVFEVTA
jgi:hypothetical protein